MDKLGLKRRNNENIEGPTTEGGLFVRNRDSTVISDGVIWRKSRNTENIEGPTTIGGLFVREIDSAVTSNGNIQSRKRLQELRRRNYEIKKRHAKVRVQTDSFQYVN